MSEVEPADVVRHRLVDRCHKPRVVVQELPARRTDEGVVERAAVAGGTVHALQHLGHGEAEQVCRRDRRAAFSSPGRQCRAIGAELRRSEEHTSELQSLMRSSYAVFCLKKKKTNNTTNIYVLNYNTNK